MASELEQQGMMPVVLRNSTFKHSRWEGIILKLSPSPLTQMIHRKIALVEEGLSSIQT